MEAELNDNCPAYLYPAIGLRGYRTGTVSVCIMDPDNWNSPDDHDHNNKHTQVHTRSLAVSHWRQMADKRLWDPPPKCNQDPLVVNGRDGSSLSLSFLTAIFQTDFFGLRPVLS